MPGVALSKTNQRVQRSGATKWRFCLNSFESDRSHTQNGGVGLYGSGVEVVVEHDPPARLELHRPPDDGETVVGLGEDTRRAAADPDVVWATSRIRHAPALAFAVLMAHTSAAVARLAREGFSVRDAAALLDLSPGRVSQLLNA
jgi:hypothetical protein